MHTGTVEEGPAESITGGGDGKGRIHKLRELDLPTLSQLSQLPTPKIPYRKTSSGGHPDPEILEVSGACELRGLLPLWVWWLELQTSVCGQPSRHVSDCG